MLQGFLNRHERCTAARLRAAKGVECCDCFQVAFRSTTHPSLASGAFAYRDQNAEVMRAALLYTHYCLWPLLEPFTVEETRKAIIDQNASKVCGSDGVHTRTLEDLFDTSLVRLLTDLYNPCLKDQMTSLSWNSTDIYLIVKDRTKPKTIGSGARHHRSAPSGSIRTLPAAENGDHDFDAATSGAGMRLALVTFADGRC